MNRRARSNTLLWAAGASLVAAGWAALQRRDIAFADLERKYASATSRYIGLPGGLRVHYRDEGDPKGQPIILIHGFFASLHTWEPWVDRLCDRFRVISIDLPGHGLTRAPHRFEMSPGRFAEIVDAVAAHLDLGPYVVVGSSMGGAVAWTLAMKRPERLRGLVLVGSVGAPMRRSPPLPRPLMRVLASRWLRPIFRDVETRPLVERGLKTAYLDRTLVTPALVDRHLELARGPGHRDIILNSDPAASPPAEAFRAITAPSLILQGDADMLVPASSGRWLAAVIPGARLITYPRVGHVPMEQVPDKSAQDLAAFIDQLAAPGEPPKPPAKRRRGATTPKTARGRSAATRKTR